jgi:hypothetical protein
VALGGQTAPSISIAEFADAAPRGTANYNMHVAGYEIATSKQTLRLYIENEQSCCERWGYFMTEDNLDDFIGAELLSVAVVDSDLNHPKFNQGGRPIMYEGDTMFVNIETSRGTLQFVAYNEHNGHYGHQAGVVSTQLTHQTRL